MRQINSGIGVVKLERVRVICPACGEQVEAMAGNGRVKGYCAVAQKYVNFVPKPLRDVRGRFVKGMSLE